MTLAPIPRLTPWRALLALAALAALLAGCASLSEGQCRAGDWRGIGFADGARGRTADYVAQHQKACAEFGIAPDVAAWQAGRVEGLAQYCTPQTAYREGRAGRGMAAVCSAGQVAAMREAYLAGQQYYELELEIAELRRDRISVEAALDELGEDDADARRRLRRERDRIDDRVSSLERRQLRYDSWPG